MATGENTSELLGWKGWSGFLPALVVIVLLVPFQAAAEEYIFRGWLLQAFGAYIRSPWPGIVLGSAGFAALHAYTDWGILDVFSFGVLMGWLAVRTGGLEAPIAMHVVNNTLAFAISAARGRPGRRVAAGRGAVAVAGGDRGAAVGVRPRSAVAGEKAGDRHRFRINHIAVP
ncbi:CPBP family intramembrane glutamic endopeptidase [Nonomuraea dietziae]|uniref:CPBP family intramembrane glutamic endopeptidase n=1 Tax=Nonomuraea dietziae TaxID=65515 RepID=UPI0031D0C611